MTTEEKNNNWVEYRYHVIKTLEALEEKANKGQEEIIKIANEVTELKVKASIYGAIFGAVVTLLIQMLIYFLTKGNA